MANLKHKVSVSNDQATQILPITGSDAVQRVIVTQTRLPANMQITPPVPGIFMAVPIVGNPRNHRSPLIYCALCVKLRNTSIR